MPWALVDGAEYSLHEGTIVIALAVGGAALAAMGIVRVLHISFAQMPKGLAAAISIIGLLVMGFAAYVWKSGTPLAERQPRVQLQRDSGAPPAPAKGDVRVRVRTVSGDDAADVPVELQSGFTGETGKLSGRTDSSGVATFKGVAIDPGSPWIAVASYDNADFASDLLRAPGTYTVRIAHTTKSDRALSSDIASLALVGDERGMQALQVVGMRNRSKEASVAGVVLPILRGGTQVDPGPGLDRASLMVDKRNNIVSIAPLLPGRQQFTYSYIGPMQRRGQPFHLTVPYATGRFDLLVGGKLDFRPKGGLHRRGSVTLGGRTYRRYTAEHVRKGQALSGTVILAQSRTLTTLLIVLAALLALAILLVPLLRRRRRDTPADVATEREPQPEWT